MNTPRIIADFIWGFMGGFIIETASSLGTSWLTAPIYDATGIVLNTDPFLFEYPLIDVLIVIGFLCWARRAYAMSAGVFCGYLLGTLVLTFMLWGA